MNHINVILAEHPGLGRVRLCECSAIHLAFGPVAITLDPQVFELTVTLMREAMEQLAEITAAKRAQCTSLETFEPHTGDLTQ